ncbi:MAG: GNAT family N-acetyltransferase [Opitutales bacterium]|nr:GNAT family N-acetyltransferase [Opitutales bacterium]
MGKIRILESEHYSLRKLTMDDAAEVFEILSDPGIVKYLNLEAPKNLSDAQKIVAEYLEAYRAGTKYPFAIVSRGNGMFLGVLLLKVDLYDEDCFEYTAYVKRDFQGRGVLSEVFPLMLSFAFEEVGTGNVRGFIKQGNEASAKLCRKNKMLLEKIFDVPGIPEKIESYLMTRERYNNLLAGTQKK